MEHKKTKIMLESLAGIKVSEILPPTSTSALQRRVITEKWYGRNGIPRDVADNPKFIKSIANIIEKLYLVNSETADVEIMYVSRIGVSKTKGLQYLQHNGIRQQNVEISQEAFMCLYDKNGGDSTVRVGLLDILDALDKKPCYINMVGHRFACSSELSALKLLHYSIIPNIVSDKRRKKNINVSKKKWESKRMRLKNLEQINRRIGRKLQENY